MRRKYELSPGKIFATGVLGGLGMLTAALAMVYTNFWWITGFIICAVGLLGLLISILLDK